MSYDVKHLNEGIARKKVNNEYVYYYINNEKIITKKDLDRINKLRIPPAWANLWVARDPDSTIQAIGTDVKGRKQYRYHHVHIESAEKDKFIRLYNFIKDIPKLNKVLSIDGAKSMYDRSRIISVMLQMVQDYHMRVGKEIYAKKNKSYGISSLRKKHVKISNGVIHLKFKGKSNQRLHYTIRNDYYIKSIKMLMKLDGDKLFQYTTIDDNNVEKIMNITDRDLNQYIQENMGPEYSIKDFRTYGANYYFIKSLLRETQRRTPSDRRAIKKNIIGAFKSTARQLKHTKSISKKSYVMNFALELYQNNPELFTEHKNEDPNDFLILLLKMYKKNVLTQ